LKCIYDGTTLKLSSATGAASLNVHAGSGTCLAKDASAVTAALIIDRDVSTIVFGSEAYLAFEMRLKSDIATALTVTADRIHVVRIKTTSESSVLASFYVLPDIAGTPIETRALITAFGSAGVSIARSLTTAPVSGLTSRNTVEGRLTVVPTPGLSLPALDLGSASRDAFEVDFRTDVSNLLGIDEPDRISILDLVGSAASATIWFAVLPGEDAVAFALNSLSTTFSAGGLALTETATFTTARIANAAASDAVTCRQPTSGATSCADAAHCVFTADPDGGPQGSCSLTPQADCTAALEVDTDGTMCNALKCTHTPADASMVVAAAESGVFAWDNPTSANWLGSSFEATAYFGADFSSSLEIVGKVGTCVAKDPAAITCSQPADGDTVCPDNTEHCVFTADAGGGSQGSCALTSQADCTAALDVDTDGTECTSLNCEFGAANPVAFLQVENNPLFNRGTVSEDCTAIDTDDAAAVATCDGIDLSGDDAAADETACEAPGTCSDPTATTEADCALLATPGTWTRDCIYTGARDSFVPDVRSCIAKDPRFITCGQPENNEVTCPDNLEHCVFVPPPGGTQGSCVLTSQADCAVALGDDSDGTSCQDLKCTYKDMYNDVRRVSERICAAKTAADLSAAAGIGVAEPRDCGQPADGDTICPDNTEHCVFTADPGGGSQGSCALTSQTDCTAALAADTDGTECTSLKCRYDVTQRSVLRTCTAKDSSAITCTQPDELDTQCPDNREHCIFTSGGTCSEASASTEAECDALLPVPGVWTPSSCALTSQDECTAALDVDLDGVECNRLKCSYAVTPLEHGWDGRLYGNVNFQVGQVTSVDPKLLTVQAEEAVVVAISQSTNSELRIEAGPNSVDTNPTGGESAQLTLQTTSSCTAKPRVACGQPAAGETVCPDNLDVCVFTPDPNDSNDPAQGSCATTEQPACTVALFADLDGTRCMELKCTYAQVGDGAETDATFTFRVDGTNPIESGPLLQVTAPITCGQPADGATSCPDNPANCVFSAGGTCSDASVYTEAECLGLDTPGSWTSSTQGSCALSSQWLDHQQPLVLFGPNFGLLTGDGTCGLDPCGFTTTLTDSIGPWTFGELAGLDTNHMDGMLGSGNGQFGSRLRSEATTATVATALTARLNIAGGGTLPFGAPGRTDNPPVEYRASEGDPQYAGWPGEEWPDCVDGCASKSSLELAMAHCDQFPECKGITQVSFSGYETRGGDELVQSIFGYHSWTKVGHAELVVNSGLGWNGASATFSLGRQRTDDVGVVDDYVVSARTSGTQITWEEVTDTQMDGSEIEGQGVTHSSLEDAQERCRELFITCGGVTRISTGPNTYQLFSGANVQAAVGRVSWKLVEDHTLFLETTDVGGTDSSKTVMGEIQWTTVLSTVTELVCPSTALQCSAVDLNAAQQAMQDACFEIESCTAIDPANAGHVATCSGTCSDANALTEADCSALATPGTWTAAGVLNGDPLTCTNRGTGVECAHTPASTLLSMPSSCSATCNTQWMPFYFCVHFQLAALDAATRLSLLDFKDQCESDNPLDVIDPLTLCALEDVKKNHGFGNYVSKGKVNFGPRPAGSVDEAGDPDLANSLTVESRDSTEGSTAALVVMSGGNNEACNALDTGNAGHVAICSETCSDPSATSQADCEALVPTPGTWGTTPASAALDGIPETCTNRGTGVECVHTPATASVDATFLMAAPGGPEEVQFRSRRSVNVATDPESCTAILAADAQLCADPPTDSYGTAATCTGKGGGGKCMYSESSAFSLTRTEPVDAEDGTCSTCTDAGTVCADATTGPCPAGCGGVEGACTGTATCELGAGGTAADCPATCSFTTSNPGGSSEATCLNLTPSAIWTPEPRAIVMTSCVHDSNRATDPLALSELLAGADCAEQFRLNTPSQGAANMQLIALSGVIGSLTTNTAVPSVAAIDADLTIRTADDQSSVAITSLNSAALAAETASLEIKTRALVIESCTAAGTTHASTGAELSAIDEDDAANTITLATADATILAGHSVQLADKGLAQGGGATGCLAAPLDQDLVVASVNDAVITFETASDLTAGDVDLSDNCVLLTACDLVDNSATAPALDQSNCETAGTGSQCTYTAPTTDYTGRPKLTLDNRNPLTLELRRPHSCAAVDSAVAADVVLCSAVVSDAVPATCEGAGRCSVDDSIVAEAACSTATGIWAATPRCIYSLSSSLDVEMNTCAATDPAIALDVATCGAVVSDGNEATCTDAGDCSYQQATALSLRTDKTAAVAEACTAIDDASALDVAACGTVVNDGSAATCTSKDGGGKCTYTPLVLEDVRGSIKTAKAGLTLSGTDGGDVRPRYASVETMDAASLTVSSLTDASATVMEAGKYGSSRIIMAETGTTCFATHAQACEEVNAVSGRPQADYEALCAAAAGGAGACEWIKSSVFTATCTETVVEAQSDATDQAACAEVSALEDSTACEAIMTASALDSPTLKACTYKPASMICQAADTVACTAKTTKGQTECEAAGACTYSSGLAYNQKKYFEISAEHEESVHCGLALADSDCLSILFSDACEDVAPPAAISVGTCQDALDTLIAAGKNQYSDLSDYGLTGTLGDVGRCPVTCGTCPEGEHALALSTGSFDRVPLDGTPTFSSVFATDSGTHPGIHDGSLAFDGDNTTFWDGCCIEPAGQWLGYNQAKPYDVVGYALQTGYPGDPEYGDYPTSWNFQGRNSASEAWVTIDSQSNQPMLEALTYFTFTSNVQYQQFRWEFLGIDGGDSNSATPNAVNSGGVVVREARLMESTNAPIMAVKNLKVGGACAMKDPCASIAPGFFKLCGDGSCVPFGAECACSTLEVSKAMQLGDGLEDKISLVGKITNSATLYVQAATWDNGACLAIDDTNSDNVAACSPELETDCPTSNGGATCTWSPAKKYSLALPTTAPSGTTQIFAADHERCVGTFIAACKYTTDQAACESVMDATSVRMCSYTAAVSESCTPTAAEDCSGFTPGDGASCVAITGCNYVAEVVQSCEAIHTAACGGSAQSCTATDPNSPADVEACGNVAADASQSTCENAGDCVFAAATTGADISGNLATSEANCMAVPGRCSYFPGGADGTVLTSASPHATGISTVSRLGGTCSDPTVSNQADCVALPGTWTAGSIASGFGSITLSSDVKSGGMVSAGSTIASVDARLASCAVDDCSVMGDFTMCTDVTGAQSCVASGVACGCGSSVSLGMSDLYDASKPDGDITFNGRVHGILLQQVSGSSATAAVCEAVTLPSDQATCEAAQAGGRSLCTYTAANPAGIPPVEEACTPSATRMVFPNRDDPDKVLNVIFNAFFYDPYFNTPLGHTDMLLPDMPAPAWPAAQSCGNPSGVKCEYDSHTAAVSGGGDLFVSSYVTDVTDNALTVTVQGSVGVIEIDAMHLTPSLDKNEELRVHIINRQYIFEGSVVVSTLADIGVGGWAMVRDARIDDGGGGVVIVVKNLCHELLGTAGGSTTTTSAAGAATCATQDGEDGGVRVVGNNKVKVAFAVFSSSADEQAKDEGVDHCDPNPCADNGDAGALCTSAEFSHTCVCSAGYGGAACELCADLTAPASNCFEQSCSGATHWCPAGASANAESCVASCASCGDYTTDPVTFTPWADTSLSATTTRYGTTCQAP
jgi:hypothetical protein